MMQMKILNKYLTLNLILSIFFCMLPMCAFAEEPSSFYSTVDLCGYINSKAYLNSENYKSVTIESNNDFFSWGGDTYRHNFALDFDSINENLIDGKLIGKSGIPYEICSEGALAIRGNYGGVTYSPSVTIDIPSGEYKSINFVAFSILGSKTYGSFYVTIKYSDGTETDKKIYLQEMAPYDAADDITIAEVDYYTHWESKKNLGSTITSFSKANTKTALYEYRVRPTVGKTVTSVTFKNNVGDYANWYEPAKVLAVTLEQVGVEEMIMNNLADVDEITIDNLQDVYDSIKILEGVMEAQNKTEETLNEEARNKLKSVRQKCEDIKISYVENLISSLPDFSDIDSTKYYLIKDEIFQIEKQMEKYNVTLEMLNEEYHHKLSYLKDNIEQLKPSYTMFDISDYCTSKLFIDAEESKSVKIERPHDYFNYGQAGTYYNNFALDADSIPSLVVEDKSHIPYTINGKKAVPVSGSDYEITDVSTATLDLSDGVYNSLNFLAFSVTGTVNYNSLTITIVYNDESTTTVKKFPIRSCLDGSNTQEDKDWVFGVPSYTHYTSGNISPITTFSLNAGNCGIYTYSITPEKGKVVDKLIFSQANSYLGWYEKFKVLAVSATDASATEIYSYTQSKIISICDNDNISSKALSDIKANLDKLESLGISCADMNKIDEFNQLYKNIFGIENTSFNTTVDTIKVDIEFLSEAKKFDKEKITVKHGGNIINSDDITFTSHSTQNGIDSIQLSFPNYLGYSSEYTVTLSKDIKSAFDERLSIFEDKKITFLAIPPIEFSNTTLTDKRGVPITEIADFLGKNVFFSTDLLINSDNQSCSFMVGVYTSTDKLLSKSIFEGSESGTIKGELAIPAAEDSYTVEFYAIDSYDRRMLVWEPIILFGGE